MSKRGLPSDLRMRHDAHYVEELAQARPTPIGRLISIDRLDPNPEQPRIEIGDLSGLISSIKEKGILEPLLVKPSALSGRWMIIAGERRWRSAREAGLRDVPCIELEVDDRAVAEIALIENLQRKDLTAWEEADGLLALSERFGYTHEEIARKVGKSRSTVTEALSIASLPDSVRQQCRQADIGAKSVLLQIVRQPDIESMQQMVHQISGSGLTRQEARDLRKRAAGVKGSPGRPAPKVFRYVPADKSFRLELKFRRAQMETAELVELLRSIASTLEAGNPNGSSDRS